VGAWEVEDDPRLIGAGVAVDFGKGAKELPGDEGRRGSATCGNLIFDDQIGNGGKKGVDLAGGVEFVGWAGEVKGEIGFLGVACGATLTQASLLSFDSQRYRLLAWVVMPNHVHVLFQATDGWTVAKIVAVEEVYGPQDL
jgi:hypothetical protein